MSSCAPPGEAGRSTISAGRSPHSKVRFGSFQGDGLLKWMTASEFEIRWGAAHRAVFGGRRVFDDPFGPKGWSSALLVGGLRLDEADLRAMGVLAGLRGDTDFAALDAERRFPDDEVAATGTWDAECLEALHLSWLGHTEVHVFGRSESWGWACANEGFSIFGAPAELFASFLQRVGGRDYLREQFLDEFSSEVSSALAGDPRSQWIRRVIEDVGWDHD